MVARSPEWHASKKSWGGGMAASAEDSDAMATKKMSTDATRIVMIGMLDVMYEDASSSRGRRG